MTWAVAWRPLAERDFTECTAHIAQDNTEAALRFVDAVEETVASLAENPMLSTATHFVHPDLAGLRRRVVNGFKRHLIFYRNESAAQTRATQEDVGRSFGQARPSTRARLHEHRGPFPPLRALFAPVAAVRTPSRAPSEASL
jgi:toxin ParE1/3/4